MKDKLKIIIIPAIIAVILVIIIVITQLFTNDIKTTFDVNTGDKIQITLQSNNGYTINNENPFIISQDGKTISTGTFDTGDAYDTYRNLITENNLEILDEGKAPNFDYFMYNNENEYNYVIRMSNTRTCIILSNTISENSAKDCFKKLDFSLVIDK